MDTGSLAQPLKRAAIGAKVRKQFQNDADGALTWFDGTVTSYDSSRRQ
jgi:hypothetical protein